MTRSKLDEALMDLVSGKEYHEDLVDIVAAIKKTVIDALPPEYPDSWQGNQPQLAFELGRRQYHKEVLRLLESSNKETKSE